MEHLGRHLILEYYGVDESLLNDVGRIETIMVDAAKHMRATVVTSEFHHFNPHGVSGAVIISESHLTIHTWPEFGYAAVDVFTCGNVIDPWQAHALLSEKFKPTKESTMEFKRGVFDVPSGTLPATYDLTE